MSESEMAHAAYQAWLKVDELLKYNEDGLAVAGVLEDVEDVAEALYATYKEFS